MTRFLPIIALMLTTAVGCGGGGGNGGSDDLTAAKSGDMAAAEPTLTVKNTLSWCDVTVTVGTSGTPDTFGTAAKSYPAAAATVVTLHAVPHPTFLAVQWTGVTTMTGADATYTMTSAAAQSVTACCPLADGSGC